MRIYVFVPIGVTHFRRRGYALSAAGDAQAIAAALAQYAGVDKASLKFDPAAKTLSLRYDSMQLAKKNIEISIAQAGFTANGVTPESVGARPKKN